MAAKTNTLSIFLLKETATTPKRIFKDPTTLEQYPIRVGRTKLGDLYVEPSTVDPASWVSFFAGQLPATVKLLSASAAGVFITKGGDRRFALTFGHGRHLFKPGAWEENFGLRV